MNAPGDRPAKPLLREEEAQLLRGRIFDVVAARITLPSGLDQELWIVEHPGAVAVAPLNEKGELLLVRQYRHAVRQMTLEIPAGRLEAGEVPLEAAKRELAEETGRSAGAWRALTTFLPAPGFCSERIHLFEAQELAPVLAHPDADEELEVVSLPPERVLAETNDGKTLLAAALLLLQRAQSGRPAH